MRTAAWLGRQDSNLGMAESKSAALPLGYAPFAACRRGLWHGTVGGGRARADHTGMTACDQCPVRMPADAGECPIFVT